MRIAIGLPITDSIPGEAFGFHVATIVEAVKYKNSTLDVRTISPVGLCPHDYARHMIGVEAVKMDCDRLFFMDDDTITPKGGFSALMEVMDLKWLEKECPDGIKRMVPDPIGQAPAMVSGSYLRRGTPYTAVWSCERAGNWYNVDADQGIHQIHVSGLGCCLIDLHWLREHVPQPWFRMKQNDTHTIITDDVVLFESVRAADGLILGNANVQCPHIGRREFIVRESADALRIVHSQLERMFTGAKNESPVTAYQPQTCAL